MLPSDRYLSVDQIEAEPRFIKRVISSTHVELDADTTDRFVPHVATDFEGCTL